MLTRAFASAYQYTRPLIILKRLENRTIAAGVGTFFLINKDGWAITAAHLIAELAAAEQHKQEHDKYLQECALIDADTVLSEGKKKHRKGQLHRNFEWITKLSCWWGGNGVTMASGIVHSDVQADIAIVQLAGIQNLNVTEFPKFASVKRPLQPGMTMCRLGFPFNSINAQFDEALQDFVVPPMASIPMFPNDGIHTRVAIEVHPPNNRQVAFLETSSPGLRGQSGGPIFDRDGIVWALQSKTSSLPLGFNTEYISEGRKRPAPEQFIHVGLGTHVQHIRDLLGRCGVKFEEHD
jgi:hypothetical protein